MKTLIFDIDGTITDMWPLEKAVLLQMLENKFEKDIEKSKSGGINSTYTIYSKLARHPLSKKTYTRLYNKIFNSLLRRGALPKVKKYSIVKWIIKNRDRFHFVYATGGQRSETLYALRSLGLFKIFDVENSLDKSICNFNKATGIPFQKIKSRFPDCVLITNGVSDCKGAIIAGISFIQVRPGQDIAQNKSCGSVSEHAF